MPNNVATGFGYDPADNVTSTTVGAEALMSAVFDPRNNFISGGTTTDTVDTVYNRLDKPVRMVESATGRVTSDTLDIMGRLTSRYDKTGLTKYFYNDSRGLTTKIADPEGRETTYTYNSASAPIGVKQDNGIITTLGYNIDSQNTTISAAGGAFSLVFGYQYDLDGLITTETVDGSQTIYGYDKLSHLISWRPNAATETAYVYGLDGDRTSMTDSSGTTTYGYDAGTHQLRSSSGPSGDISYDYGDNGELKHKVTIEGTTTYDWNDKGQLTKIAMPDSTATFTYDARGNRIKKDVDGTAINYVYDGLKLIAEKDASGSVTAAYTYDTGGRLISVYKNSNTYYYHLNQRGDVVKITDQSKNVVASYSYDPWGNILSAGGSFANEQPFRYASYMWDVETGLYFLAARYYDPATGRFISRDAEDIGDVTPAINPYVYAEGNPVSFVDPSGNDIVLPGYTKNNPVLVKHLRFALSNMGFYAGATYTKDTWDDDIAHAVFEFKKTHLGWGGDDGGLHPLTSLYGNDSYVNQAVLNVIEYWNVRQTDRNDFGWLEKGQGNVPREASVYGVMDGDWRDAFWKQYGAGLSSTAKYAPGRAAIRRRFRAVNEDYDARSGIRGFPGGMKFTVYDIQFIRSLETPSGKISEFKNKTLSNAAYWGRRKSNWQKPNGTHDTDKFRTYDMLAIFTKQSDWKTEHGVTFAPDSWGVFTTFDSLAINYSGSANEEALTLKHELAHIFGASECNWAGELFTNPNCCGLENLCLMASGMKVTGSGWCPTHSGQVKGSSLQKSW